MQFGVHLRIPVLTFQSILLQVPKGEGLLISGVIRGSAISAMLEGDNQGICTLTDDCTRIQDVLKDVFMKHERRKCGMGVVTRLGMSSYKKNSSKLLYPTDVHYKKDDRERNGIPV